LTTDSPIALVVGAASRDVVADDPRGWRLGGAVAYGSLSLARLGLQVWALVGADREAAGAHELELLRAAGVSIAIADLASGPVFDNAEHLLLSTSDTIPVSALPRRWATGFDALLLAPVAAELGNAWAGLARADPAPLVALGWQGLLRVLATNTVIRPRPPETTPLSRAADVAVVSEADVDVAFPPHALLGMLRPGATLAWTQGARGGLLLEAELSGRDATARPYPAIPSDSSIDPTGAGDVFLAGLVAARLQPSLGDPVTVAAAAASLTVEGPGLAGVPDLAAVRRRMTRPPSLASRRPSDSSNRETGRPSQA
jgi:sugar/nucleoside kinase (ribokinase family)